MYLLQNLNSDKHVEISDLYLWVFFSYESDNKIKYVKTGLKLKLKVKYKRQW
jgi:hypothetical protein